MTITQLLRWATGEYAAETPYLDHSQSEKDAGGAPVMEAAPAAWLGILARKMLTPDERPDNWRALACRIDQDGRYITPMRCAIERIPDPDRREFLRHLVTNTLFPGDIAALHSIPRWAAGDVIHRSLSVLQAKYRDRPETPVGWVSRSDAQRAAEEAA